MCLATFKEKQRPPRTTRRMFRQDQLSFVTYGNQRLESLGKSDKAYSGTFKMLITPLLSIRVSLKATKPLHQLPMSLPPAPSTTLFYLLPKNCKAKQAVEDNNNVYLASMSARAWGISLAIGFHIRSAYSPNTLAALGRSGCDIYLKSATIHRLQCSFEVDDSDTGIVMLYDRSTSHNTRVSRNEKLGHTSETFEQGRAPRRVLLYPMFNESISMGGKNGELYQFQLEWTVDGDQAKRVVREYKKPLEHAVYNPRTARTYDSTLNALPRYIKMTLDSAFQQNLRYYIVRNARGGRIFVGHGTFGTVYRAIDIDTGRAMAMKELNWKHGTQLQSQVEKVRREVDLMRRARHVV